MATLHRLILASGSLGRRELLKQAGYQFEVFPSNIDEHDGKGVTDPRRYVAELAWQKAAAVSSQLTANSLQLTPHTPLRTQDSALSTIVLAADSTVWHKGEIIGKPVDEADARRILGSLAGTTHELWTGVCLWRLEDGVQFCWQEKSDVAFRPLSHDEFEHLITSNVWEGKAGGYGIESVGDPYLTVKTGTISNVIGLPMESLGIVLKQFGY
ncbi:MAG: Maf family protein [Gemmatales bacterium]